MVRILIPTQLNDIHATAVEIALRRKGHEAVLWHGADFPTRQRSSLSISRESGIAWEASGPALDLHNDPFDAVWFRRPTLPVLPEELDLHPGDRQIAQRECRAFFNALWHLVSPDAFWVNPMASRARSNTKSVQLVEALRSGLAIPPTLCSNDPGKIRSFLREHEGEAVFKSFVPAQWKKDRGVAMLFTSSVTEDDLPDDDILALTPGIFQRKIPKDYELRVTYIGHHAITAKLLSQEKESSRLDWKAALAQIPVEEATLPEEVDRCCRELMRRLGIVFGCFDFVVTPEGEHVFLEVNEMGQFLWLDQFNPNLMTLDPFCELLIQGRPDFDWKPSAQSVLFSEVSEEALARREADAALHVKQPDFALANDSENPDPERAAAAPAHEHCHHHP